MTCPTHGLGGWQPGTSGDEVLPGRPGEGPAGVRTLTSPTSAGPRGSAPPTSGSCTRWPPAWPSTTPGLYERSVMRERWQAAVAQMHGAVLEGADAGRSCTLSGTTRRRGPRPRARRDRGAALTGGGSPGRDRDQRPGAGARASRLGRREGRPHRRHCLAVARRRGGPCRSRAASPPGRRPRESSASLGPPRRGGPGSRRDPGPRAARAPTTSWRPGRRLRPGSTLTPEQRELATNSAGQVPPGSARPAAAGEGADRPARRSATGSPGTGTTW